MHGHMDRPLHNRCYVALTFVSFAGSNWLEPPTPIPAILFRVVTVLAPFFIMQPSFGLGFAASQTSHPRWADSAVS